MPAQFRLQAPFQPAGDQPRAILFIDEIHTLIGAGAASAVRWTPATC